MNNWLFDQARQRPDRPALVFGDHRWTYARLADRVRHWAALFERFVDGDNRRIALCGANRPDWIIAAHGAWWIGATVIGLHHRATTPELETQLEVVDPSLVIGATDIDSRRWPRLSWDEARRRAGGQKPRNRPRRLDGDEPLTILFTSGTSGRPKAVVSTVANHRASARGTAARLGIGGDDRWLCTLPLCHVGGLAIASRCAIYGATVELVEGFDADEVLRTIEERPVTVASFVPTMLVRLLEQRSEPIPGDLRSVLVGGGAMSAELLQRARQAHLPVLPTYGMTEATSQITTLSPSASADALETAGRPLPGIELEIRDDDGAPLAAGAVGRIFVRGSTISPGYAGTATRHAPGDWFDTGDRGHLDGTGRLVVDPHRGDRIVTGGENVDPYQVESLLRGSDEVADAAVVGLEDDHWGEIVGAAVVADRSGNGEPSQPFDFDRLDTLCRRELAPFKVPRRWTLMSQIPRTVSHKIRRDEVRELFIKSSATHRGERPMTRPAPTEESSSPTEPAPETADGEYPKVAAHCADETTPVHVGDVPFGTDAVPVIAGPCAVESRDLIAEAAALVADRGAAVLRGGAYKPRTSPYSFQGTGHEGLKMMREAADNAGLPLVTEVMSPRLVASMEPLVDAFQIGARNMQNIALLRAVGDSDRPVLLKRHFGATPREWILAAEHIAAAGNDRIILCERGIRSFGDETRFTLDLAGALWVKSRVRLPVIVDPSHAIGIPRLLPAAATAAVAAGLDGVMVEVHPDQTRALCDADQALTEDQFAELIDQVDRATDVVDRRLWSRN